MTSNDIINKIVTRVLEYKEYLTAIDRIIENQGMDQDRVKMAEEVMNNFLRDLMRLRNELVESKDKP